MSAALELLAELRRRGARIRVLEGDALHVGPRAALDPDLLARLREAKPQVLELLRAAPTNSTLCSPAIDEIGGGPSGLPHAGLSPEQCRELLDRSVFEMHSPHVPGGMCLLARDARSLDALGDEPITLPVFFQVELEQLRDALRTVRSVFAIELRRVTRSHVDG